MDALQNYFNEQQSDDFTFIIFKVLLILISYFLLKYILKHQLIHLFEKVASKTTTTLDDLWLPESLNFLNRLLVIGFVYFVFIAFETMIEYPTFWNYFNHLVYLAFIIAVYIFAHKSVHVLYVWYSQEIAIKTNSTIDDEFGPLFERFLKIAVFSAFFTLILDHFGQDIKVFLVSLGVGSFAIAFAAKETLSNMISGFVIMIDRPFRVGDRIKLSDGTVGVVQDIGLRTTRLVDFENNVLLVPNADIAASKIINFAYPSKQIRITLMVGVAYGSDVEQIKTILLETAHAHEFILKDPEPTAIFMDMADSALMFRLTAHVADYKDAFTTTEQIRTVVYNRLNAEHIEIPFPQRVVHLKNDESK